MAGTRPLVNRGGITAEFSYRGDTLLLGESITDGLIVTAGAGIWTAPAMVSGWVQRSGPGAGFTDTTDTSNNILIALGANLYGAVVSTGSTFRMVFFNSTAFAMTFAAGTGIVSGSGILTCAASLWREYLITILNAMPQVILQCNTTVASPVVTFVLPPNMTSYPIGPAPNAINVSPGMTVSGTNVTAGTTVIGITQGQGGVIGFTMSANALATSTAGVGVSLTLLPTIRIDGLRSGTA